MEVFKKEYNRLKERFSHPGTLMFQSLVLAEDIFGYVPEEVIEFLSTELNFESNEILMTLTFYHFLHTRHKGKHKIYLCTNIPCALRGAYEILDILQEELNIGVSETTNDEEFSLHQTECIGQCDFAPAALVNNKVIKNLSPDKVKRLIKELS